jgi:mono/diheme cytochrome c family protein
MLGTQKRWMIGVAATLVLLVGVQAVPYGRAHTNPRTVQEPAWDSAETRALAGRACFDCHSNETKWPWYSQVAPISWLVQRDVDEGRAVLNFSEWNRPYEEASEASEEVAEGEMPPRAYALMHAHARLSPAERDRLAKGLAKSVGKGGRGRAH